MLFVVIPTPYQVYEDVFERYVGSFNIHRASVDLYQPNRLLAVAFELNGLKLLDPIELMRERSVQAARLYGQIDGHLSAEGHRVLAEYVLPEVEKLLARSISIDRQCGKSGTELSP